MFFETLCRYSYKKWLGGGIGRRDGLKIRFPQGSVGSSPTRATDH